MRRSLPVILAVLLVSGCGGDGEADPASLDDCAAVAEAAVAVIQQTIDVLEVAAGGTEPDPEIVAGIEAEGSALEERAEEMGARLARDEGMLAVIEGAAAVAGLEQLAAAGTVTQGSRVVVLQTGHPANYE